MQVRLLGSVDVLIDGAVREVPGLRRKAVLAVLAVRPGEIVSTDQIVDAVWGERPPGNALATLQNHVSRLRAVLSDPSAIVARAPGYLLKLGEEATDVQVALRLIDQARASADPGERERLLRDAVAMWRGQPLADLAGPAGLIWFDQHARRLVQLGLHARIGLLDTRLQLGQHGPLIPDLEELAAAHPWNEQVHRQLMLALYRAGRQHDALAVFRRLRDTLGEELGVEPGADLRKLETAILRHDPTLATPELALPQPPLVASAPSERKSLVLPAQLPAAAGSFTGRTRELANLDSFLPGSLSGSGPHADSDPETGSAGPGTVRVITICGSAGIGKTTLAVHWAHRVAHHFPDGQLYVNLRGFDPGGQALDPGTAVRGFLDALGIPGDRIPTGLDAQIGLYRSLLSGNRILVVLDNARHVEQVRPLLPATPGCLAIVTSRHHLTPLVVTEGAHPLTLDVLTAAEAHDLLIHRLGADRVAGEPDAVDKIIARCARLPLALAIVAARAATHPSFPLNAIVAELVAPASRLDALHGGDPATDLRAVFACSYQTLSAGAARMFRLLGLHPGPDTGTPAAASLAAIPVDQARQLLAELVQAHLLTEHTPGRYTFHDLLRGYATDQAQTRDSDHDRHAARCRLLDHYLHTAHRARMLLSPSRQPITLTPPQPGVTPEPIGDHDHALAWLAAEYTVLQAATEQAATCGFDNHAWQLAWAMRTFANWQGLWHEQIAIDHTALAATSRLGDMFAGARTLDGLASSYFRSRRLVDAETHYRQALDLYTELGDLAGQAEAHSGLSLIAESECRLVDGLWHVQREVELLRTSGDRARYAMSLNNLGMLQALLGNYQQALSTCSQALTLLQEHADLQAEGLTWDSLGYAHRGLADYAQSVSCYRRAIDLFQRAGDRYNDADSHIALGDTCQAAGDTDAAHAAWEHAAHVFEQLNHTDVQRARAKLMSGPPTRQESQPRR